MASDKGLQIVEITPAERQMVFEAMETLIAVKRRRINTEKNAGIKGLLQQEVSSLIDVSRKFAL